MEKQDRLTISQHTHRLRVADSGLMSFPAEQLILKLIAIKQEPLRLPPIRLDVWFMRVLAAPSANATTVQEMEDDITTSFSLGDRR